jgi:hypothetical protein
MYLAGVKVGSEPLIVLGAGRAGPRGKGRTGRRSLPRQQSPNRQERTPRPSALPGIAQKAQRPKGERCRHRYGRRHEDCLQQGWRDIRQEAAAGVAHVRAQASAQPLDAHLHDLGERLQQKR